MHTRDLHTAVRKGKKSCEQDIRLLNRIQKKTRIWYKKAKKSKDKERIAIWANILYSNSETQLLTFYSIRQSLIFEILLYELEIESIKNLPKNKQIRNLRKQMSIVKQIVKLNNDSNLNAKELQKFVKLARTHRPTLDWLAQSREHFEPKIGGDPLA